MPNALIHTIEPEGSLHAEHDTVLSERNVCIAYHKEGRAALHKTLAGPSDKRWVQPQQLIARDELMDPNGTTTWQGAAARSVLYGFSEYTLNYFELLVTRPARDEAERRRLDTRCARRRLGFALPFSFNNVYHAIFHAVPASEWWAQLSASATAADIRDDGDGSGDGGGGVTFVPILHPRMSVRAPTDAAGWFAWEFAVRAMTSRSWPSLARETTALLRHPCTCFERLEGSGRAFNFNARLGARPRLQAFRRALLSRLARMPHRLPPTPAASPAAAAAGPVVGKRTMLYVHRQGRTRAVTNEAALHAALLKGVPHLRRVVMDGMPLREQMETVAAATSLLAAFGQALTWMILLPPHASDQAAATAAREAAAGGGGHASGAVLELSPRDAFWKQDYQILAKVLGLRFNRVYGQVSQCPPQPAFKVRWQQRLAGFNRWLSCNLTVDVPSVVEAARALEGLA
jgi:hypothetical protein